MLTQDEKDYLKRIPASKKVSIKPFDPKAKTVGESIIAKIKNALPKSKVLFMGATALGIAGQNDIDIYILSNSKDFNQYLPILEKLFGKPKHVHKTFIEWKLKKNSYSVELYLTEPPERQIKIFETLKANKNLLEEYENLKLRFDGKSFRDYQKAKYEFYNKILDNNSVDIQRELAKYGIKPDPLKDQFFLTDKDIIRKIVGFADLNKNDVVLEVGAGTGNLTKEIAKRAGRMIAFEIDKRFRPFLNKLPKNVEVHYENAWNFVQLHGKFKKKKEYNKVVANLPYSFIEPFLHNLTFLEYDKVILLIPVKFLKKIDGYDVFGSFFKTKILFEVPKEKFYPIPRSNSVVIDLIKLPDPIKTKNLGLFLRQYMYQHEGQLVKNSLMEGIIKYARSVHSKKLTKNKAREIISDSEIPKKLLKRKANTPKIYSLAGTSFDKKTFKEKGYKIP